MKVSHKLLIDHQAVEDLVDLIKVQPDDRLVLFFRSERSEEQMDIMLDILDGIGLKGRAVIIQIPEGDGEVLVVKGSQS